MLDIHTRLQHHTTLQQSDTGDSDSAPKHPRTGYMTASPGTESLLETVPVSRPPSSTRLRLENENRFQPRATYSTHNP